MTNTKEKRKIFERICLTFFILLGITLVPQLIQLALEKGAQILLYPAGAVALALGGIAFCALMGYLEAKAKAKAK